jgi:hypothetical protein
MLVKQSQAIVTKSPAVHKLKSCEPSHREIEDYDLVDEENQNQSYIESAGIP